jgi:hypothetical protein
VKPSKEDITTVIVAGGREGVDQSLVDRTLDLLCKNFPNSTRFVHGGAKGVDSQFHSWCLDRGHKPDVFPYHTYLGASGGRSRNLEMLGACHPKKTIVVVFAGGSGTLHLFSSAKQHGFYVLSLMTAVSQRKTLEALQDE